MKSDSIDDVIKYLNDCYPFIRSEKGGTLEPLAKKLFNIKLPNFELKPRDYLEFAENELSIQKPQNLINCISHLKRAMDCQLDTFLYAFNIFDTFNKKNLSISKKLKFLEACSIFNSRSLSRLNTIRNKMEHEYEIPKIQDIEVYFDLVSAFIDIIEPLTSALYENKHINLSIEDNAGNLGLLDITYDYNIPKIELSADYCDGIYLVTDLSNISEFAYLFKIYILLFQKTPTTSVKNSIKRINSYFKEYN